MAVLVASSLLSACQTRLLLYDGARGGPVSTGVLTADGHDSYDVVSSRGAISVAPLPDNRGENLRTVLWPSGVGLVSDGESCATWAKDAGTIAQLGAALRIRQSPDGRVQAVTVTQNVYGYYSVFNVHVWDTSANPPYRFVAQLDFTEYFAHHPRLPLHICARTLGDTVSVRLWSPGEAEPSWIDGVRARRAQLPAGTRVAGAVGWYVGHLAPGDSTKLVDLTTWQYRQRVPFTRSGDRWPWFNPWATRAVQRLRTRTTPHLRSNGHQTMKHPISPLAPT